MNQKKLYSGKNLKIGILGGTFNPVHLGHMHMAESAMKYLDLDKIVFMPTGIPPHKNLEFGTSPGHRINMLTIAIKNTSNYYIDESETYMNDKSYSYLSLKRIHKYLDKTSKLFFIIGADSLMYFDKWKYPDKLLSLAAFAVIPRGEITKAQCEKKINILKKNFGGEIIYVDCEKMEMSSTKARGYNFNQNTVNIDERVAEYIKRNGLYNKNMDIDKIKEYLEKNLKAKRIKHVYGTVKEAERLAKLYDEDVEKAKLAALLHDCAKHMDNDEVKFLAKEYGFELDEIYEKQPELLHGAAGAYVAKHVFNVRDQDILDAITYHTVPRLKMKKLDKIISVADLIEESRDYPGVEELRHLSDTGLDIIFMEVSKRVIIHVLERGQLLHVNSVLVYNNLLKEIRKSDKLEQIQGDK